MAFYIYVADPNISDEYTLQRFYGDKGDTFLTEYYPPTLFIYIEIFLYDIWLY